MINEYIKDKLDFQLSDCLPKIKEILKLMNIKANIYINYPVLDLHNKDFPIKCLIVTYKGVVGLYNESYEESMIKRYIRQRFLDSDDLSNIYDKYESYKTIKFSELDNIKVFFESQQDILVGESFEKYNAIVQKSLGFTKIDERNINKVNSLGFQIKNRNKKINQFSPVQFDAIYGKHDVNLRIRGLAGSGKTILLVKKMAYLHYIKPDLKMVYVFYTLSLKQFVQGLFEKSYLEYSKYMSKPNYDNISFLHGWGNRDFAGFYSTICAKNNIERKTVADAFGYKDKFSKVCSDLLFELKTSRLNMYDKVFIDEAQDFPLTFFKLAKKSLKKEGNLYYAYDELQTLNPSESNIPTKRDIFGSNDDCEDINLDKCYRTPKDILVTAHALGLGIYSKMVNMIEDLTVWKAIGYSVENDEINYGKEVVLERKDDEIDNSTKDSIYFEVEDDINAQYEKVSNEIVNLIRNEDVLTDDMLIIDLDRKNVNENYSSFRNKLYSMQEYMDNRGYEINTNIVNKSNASKFRVDNSVPYTTIFRAKGNEANIVFILNADSLLSVSTFSRNELFTALTRSKHKVYIYGNNKIKGYIDEFDRVKSNDYKLIFTYPTKKELNEMKVTAKKETEQVKSFEKILETIKSNSINQEMSLELIKKLSNKENAKELISYLESLDED